MIGFQTENEAVVRKGFTLLKKTYNIDTDVKISEEQMRSVIDKIGDLSEPVSPLLIKNSCCQRAFLSFSLHWFYERSAEKLSPGICMHR